MTALFTASAAVRLHDEKFKLTEKRSEHRDTSEAVFQWNDEEARYYQLENNNLASALGSPRCWCISLRMNICVSSTPITLQ